MKKLFAFVFMTMVSLALLTSCGKQAATYSLTITSPSDDILPLNIQKDFYIDGEITITGGNTVPEDAQISVELFDEAGNVVRSVHSVEKGDSCLYVYHEKMFYSQDDDPERVAVISTLAPEYVVDDIDKPMDSFDDASIKCTFTDNKFRSLIVYASDVEHGRLQESDIRFVNHDGSAIDGLTESNYIARVKLLDSEGKILAEAEKDICIDNPSDSLLGRFHPEETYIRIMAMKEEKGLAANTDLPGYVSTPNGEVNGFRSMFASNDIALYANSKTNALIYNIEPSSTSYRLELSYLQYAGRIGDPNLFQAYHYDIGEPLLLFADSEQTPLGGKIIPFTPGKLLDLCRVDIVKSNSISDNFATDGIHVISTDTDLSDGVVIGIDDKFAISGALCPYQLADGEACMDDTGFYKTTNDYGFLKITFDDGNSVVETISSPSMARYDSTLSGQAVVCYYEFYKTYFAKNILEAGKTYAVTIQAYDCYLNPVEGAADTFNLTVKEPSNPGLS